MSNERPMVNIDGLVMPMTDQMYAEYLEELKRIPPHPVDPIEELKRIQIEQDAALMELAEMLAGGV